MEFDNLVTPEFRREIAEEFDHPCFDSHHRMDEHYRSFRQARAFEHADSLIRRLKLNLLDA